MGASVAGEQVGEAVSEKVHAEAEEGEQDDHALQLGSGAERGGSEGNKDDNACNGENGVFHLIDHKVGQPVGEEAHAAHDLLVLALYHRLLDDEHDDAGRDEGDRHAQDRGGQEPRDGRLGLALLERQGHRVVSDAQLELGVVRREADYVLVDLVVEHGARLCRDCLVDVYVAVGLRRGVDLLEVDA